MISREEESVRAGSMSYPVYKVYRRRFYVLFVFSFLSFNQCLFWLTFSPISSRSEEYYGINESTVDLLLSWGPIFFIPCLPLVYYLLNRTNGLRYCVLILAIVDFLSTIIRIIPLIFVSSSDPKFSSICLPFLHIGQILNAICGPLAMAPVSQLSSLWFHTNERARATTVAIMSYNLGSTLGFLLTPIIVRVTSNLPHILYIHVGLAFVGCILTFLYFPGQPPTPPSPAAELLIQNSINNQSVQSWKDYLETLLKCFRNVSFTLLVLAGGLIGGTFAAWTSLFDTTLKTEGYSPQQSGRFGFYSSLAEIIGGFCLGSLADMPRFHRSFKILIIISYICYFLCVGWFHFSIRTIFSEKKLIPSNEISIAFSVTLAGLFQGAALPLTYESLAEMMYPLPESLSASILVELINITSLVLLLIARNRDQIMNFTILCIILSCIIFASLAKFSYKRRDADRKKRNTLIPDDIIQSTQLSNQIEPIKTLSSIDLPPDTIQMDSIHHISD